MDKVIVIGSGLAGLFFALEVSEKMKVIVLTKKESIETNTNYAQGGIAAVHDIGDSSQQHLIDTVKGGKGLSNVKAVKIMVEEGPELVKKLFRIGVDFSMRSGKPDLWLEGGHTKRRIWHSKDRTGSSIEETLLYAAKINPNIEFRENEIAVDLLVKDSVCSGVRIFKDGNKTYEDILSDFVLIATGGVGQIYKFTTNSNISTGDGIAMAYRSGIDIINMEFIQFHPTSLFEDEIEEKEKSFLISEAVRGEGAIIVDKRGYEIMKGKHPMESLAPRDVIAREIDNYLKENNEKCVYLDLRAISKDLIKEKFPNIYIECLHRGIDILDNNIPVVPAAHYICGGIRVDEWGRTVIRNLYAAGETAYTGVHGANRLASNSLLEALVFSKRAAQCILSEDLRNNVISKDMRTPTTLKKTPDAGKSHIFKSRIKSVMWEGCGIVRSEEKLKEAENKLDDIENEININSTTYTSDGIELMNMLMTSRIILKSALIRKESRGLHFRKDFPQTNKEYEKDTILKKL